MPTINRNNQSSSAIPSLRDLALDALPVQDAVASIVHPQTVADEVAYDAYMGRLNSSTTGIRPLAPEYLSRVHNALRSTLAATQAAQPSVSGIQAAHAARFDTIYVGLGESLRRHDEAAVKRDEAISPAATDNETMLQSMRRKVIGFCRWLVGMMFPQKTITPEQSRIYLPNLAMGHVDHIRFQLEYVRFPTYRFDGVREHFKVTSDIRRLVPEAWQNPSPDRLYEDVRKLGKALHHAVYTLVQTIEACPGSHHSTLNAKIPLVERLAHEKAPIFVELGRRERDGVPFIQLVCERKPNAMFLFSGPKAHPFNTGNLVDAEMLEALRVPRVAPHA